MGPSLKNGVNATREEVEKVYVLLSLAFHPDIGEEGVKNKIHFKQATEAYRTFMGQNVQTDAQGEKS